ncbi:hypothetical protein PMAYCL1PPCAC_12400 [Pristionchus mayeri]|uniref:AF4/FMR2 C-terminal homology domain-containing protein n=1 Tax=Pristionchus mayeri TaxID=1317129 RepID=A0AAN4ZR29_9BILA|nr:hypothetical protein PMAYCL1PPCAC_12400 [Pristionchus mayeri]
MAQGQQDMEVDLRRQLNDVFGEFEDFAGLVGRQIFGVIPTSGVMRGLNPYSPNRIPSNAALPSASLCLQEMKNVPPLIPPLQVNRNEIENSGCASEASSSHSHMNDDENYNGGKKRKRSDNEDEGEGPNRRKEKKEENKMMRDLFDDDNEDEKGEWKERSNNVPRQGIRRMIMNMQVEPLIPPIDVEGLKKKREEEEEREERERRRRKDKEEMEKRRKEKYEEEERKRKKDEEEERRRKREEEEERKKKKDDEEKRRRKEDEEKKRKREDEEKEREKKRKEAEERRKRKEDLEREEEERRIRKERKRLEKEERRKREEEERIMKEEEIERKKNEEEQEKRRLEEEHRLENEIREREELARKMEEEKKREAERMRLEEERRKEMEGIRKEEEARRKEMEASKKKEEDERKKKEEEDSRMRRERKKEEEKKRQKTDEKDKKKKMDLNLGNRGNEKGTLPLNAISLSKLEVLKEKYKDKRKREKKLNESKEGKSGSLLNEKKKKEWNEEKGKDKKVKDLEKLAKKEVSSDRSSPMSSKNSSRVATPIPSLSLPSTSTHHHGVMGSSSDVPFSYPACLPSCRAADLVPLSPPPLEQRSDIEGYTNYAKERKHRGDASQDRVLRFLHYMESSVYFALSVSFYHPSKSNDRDLSMAGCVLKDTVDLIKHGLVLIEKEGNPHLMNRAKILCFRAQSVLNYHMYFVRSNKFPRRAEALASLESQVHEVPRESPKKEENGGKKSGDKSSTPSHSSSSNSSNMVTMPMSLWKMKSSQVSTFSHLEWSHILWNDSIKLMTVNEKFYWNTIDNLILQSFEWGCPLHVGSSLLHLSHFINIAVSWMRLEYEAERQ